MENESQPKSGIEQQADKLSLGSGMQAIQENKNQEDNSMTASSRDNAKTWQTKVEGGTVHIAEKIIINHNYTPNAPDGNKPEKPRIFPVLTLLEYYVDRPEVSGDLKQRLLANSQTLVVSAIHGLGSVGKSTLAIALTHDSDVQNHFSDGILWATLGQEPDVLSLLSSWVRSLGDYNYPVTDVHGASQHLRSLLLDKAMLLVVDDAWVDKNNGWEHVEAFKVGSARCCMLVTTRDASVGNFLGANTYSLDVMSEEQALELLSKKIKVQGKQLEDSEKESAKALALAVGYLPLALGLAAVKVANGKKWEDLIKDIKQEIARLKTLQDSGVRGVVDEEKLKKLSLQASLNLSVKWLGENDRECFVWLGVLPEDASITHKMTATLWDMDERDAEDILEYLRSQALLLPGVPLADGTITYRLHDLFHDLARNLLTSPQKPKRQGDLIGLGINWSDAHAQLLDRYQQLIENNHWHTLPDDGYIHQYLVWHLEKAGKIEEIHQLLREESSNGSNAWHEIREKLGQTAGYLKDVARAWELTEADFEKKPSRVISLQCRYGLIIASLNSLSASIPEKLLAALVKSEYWKPEQGLAYALRKQFLQDKVNTLIALFDYLPENLKKQASQILLETIHRNEDKRHCADFLLDFASKLPKELYNQALDIACQIKDERHHDEVLLSLAKNLPENLCEKALKIANQIKFESYRSDFILSLIPKLPESLYCQALEIARQIEDKYSRANVILSIAEKLQSIDLYNEILETARQIWDEYSRANVILSIAEKLQSIDLYNEALEIARQIRNEHSRALVLSSLVEKLPESNLDFEALETARQIKSESSRTNILSFLAIKFSSSNLYFEALETVLQIHDEQSRALALSFLAKKLPENLYKKALEIAHQIHDENFRALAISSLAEKLPENLYGEVLEAAHQIKNEENRAKIISSLAKKLPENLQREALEIAFQIHDEYNRANVLSSLAEKLSSNLCDKILETLCQIQREYYRINVLLSLAEKFQSIDLYKEALEIARQIHDEYSHANVLLFLGEKLQSEDLYKGALTTARQIRDEYSRANVLLPLAEKLQSIDLYNEALEIARQIQDEYFRACILSCLAEKLESGDLYKEALETACRIQNESYRADVIFSLAKSLPENLHKEVLETARQIQDEYYRGYVFSCLAEKLQLENLYEEALEIAHRIQDEFYRANILSTLAEKSSSRKLYNEALETARLIQFEEYRVIVISSLAKKLPENFYEETLEIASQVQNEYYRAKTLFSLAERFSSQNLYNKALEAARQIQDEKERAKVLSPLLKTISSNKPNQDVYNMWLEITKTTLSKLEREEFQSSIKTLTPVIYQLGGKDAIMEIATAINDVARWWS
ncbi:MAG: hypothetical protein KME64_17370 [Scytonematopsis contorta HA4267-MV1]|jgi:tetratricopeptide (TPR) repeat protein|nr:hypothetical protein [Scytonematopsis contorta HA4267-MV1]